MESVYYLQEIDQKTPLCKLFYFTKAISELNDFLREIINADGKIRELLTTNQRNLNA